MTDSVTRLTRSEVLMDTVVTVQAVRADQQDFTALADRAFDWFRAIEAACSRFDTNSEVMRLVGRAGEAVVVSPLLFEAVRFALGVARLTDGAFDPTVGRALERRGFNRHYRTGAIVHTPIEETAPPSYRDVQVDEQRRTVTLAHPLILDLGAVAKGLAIDLAARELVALGDYSVEAGGDLYVAGNSANGGPWRVGIRHPRQDGELAGVVVGSDVAICTSGDYERHGESGHHILDPRTDRAADELASVTVIAPNAMLADALSTAAFVLGKEQGLVLLRDQGVEGLLLTTTLERHATAGMARYLA